MTMGTRSLNNAFALTGLCLCFGLLISAETDASCPGPKKYYEEIGCTPVFKTPDSKCPERYNCDHLKDIPSDKCFINGHTYEIGESLREEDANPCDIACSCASGRKGPEFNCAAVDCPYEYSPGCYVKRKATDCCGGLQVCPERDEDRATCIVDGKTYRDGDYFQPAAEPEKTCYCGEGYTGENVEPFCVAPKTTLCGTMLHHINDIRDNCIPTYYHDQSPKTSCSVAYRCQNNQDAVIRKAPNPSDEPKVASESADPDMQCKFGNLTMNVGDELNQATNYDSVCVKCVCEVPPVPTCQRLSYQECDSSKHPKFN